MFTKSEPTHMEKFENKILHTFHKSGYYWLYKSNDFEISYKDAELGLETFSETSMRLNTGAIIVIVGDHRNQCALLGYDKDKCWAYFRKLENSHKTPFQKYMDQET